MLPALLFLFFTLASFNSDAQSRIPTNNIQIQEGKRIYIMTCAKCHNLDPSKPGSIGPDLYTTPREVFHTKVPHGKYPVGYKPKRNSRVMPKFLNLTNKVDMIYDYVRSTRK